MAQVAPLFHLFKAHRLLAALAPGGGLAAPGPQRAGGGRGGAALGVPCAWGRWGNRWSPGGLEQSGTMGLKEASGPNAQDDADVAAEARRDRSGDMVRLEGLRKARR